MDTDRSRGVPARSSCGAIAYASQFERPWQRAFRRANKLKQRLGIGVGIDEPVPVKSKGMWARTYSFQLNEILQAEIVANEARTNRFKRLLAQVDNDLQADQPEGKRSPTCGAPRASIAQ